MTDAPVLLTVDQLAARWGCAKDRIYNLVKRRQIPFLKLGGRIQFRAAAVDAWLLAQEQQPAAAVTPARSRVDDCAALGLPVHHRFS